MSNLVILKTARRDAEAKPWQPSQKKGRGQAVRRDPKEFSRRIRLPSLEARTIPLGITTPDGERLVAELSNNGSAQYHLTLRDEAILIDRSRGLYPGKIDAQEALFAAGYRLKENIEAYNTSILREQL